MIDLTKPIEIKYVGGVFEDGRYELSFTIGGHPGREAEAYRRLFEAAPRTKLEHGEMLAMLKDYGNRHDEVSPEYACALVAEIEGASA